MRLKSGIKLLDEREGIGKPARKGDHVVYNVKIFLNQGDEVPMNERQADYLPATMIRTEDGYRFIDHAINLGSRRAIAGVEHSLIGMKQGGYRKVRLSPHLAYRDRGLDSLIPANAVLIIELWLRQIVTTAGM
ncbi:MAG: FKBP-type peptidyl-prolyl cis-trans isomerase [Candidatus Binatia bacterium]